MYFAPCTTLNLFLDGHVSGQTTRLSCSVAFIKHVSDVLQRLRITLRPRLRPYQLRPEDSPKDLIDFNPRVSYSADHTVVLRAADVVNGRMERDVNSMEKAPLNDSDAVVVTPMSDMSSANSSHHSTESETQRF